MVPRLVAKAAVAPCEIDEIPSSPALVRTISSPAGFSDTIADVPSSSDGVQGTVWAIAEDVAINNTKKVNHEKKTVKRDRFFSANA